MKFKSLTIAAALTFSMSAAHADMLITPTLWPVAPDMFGCNLTNVSNKTRTVGIRIISNGKILQENGKVLLEPRHTVDSTVEGPSGGGPIYCEFTVEGSKKFYRGAAKIFHPKPHESDFVAVPAE